MGEQAISYDRTYYDSAQAVIQQALDPSATLKWAVSQGEITRENARAEAEAYVEHILSLDPLSEEPPDYRRGTLTTADLEAYLLDLIEQHEAR